MKKQIREGESQECQQWQVPPIAALRTQMPLAFSNTEITSELCQKKFSGAMGIKARLYWTGLMGSEEADPVWVDYGFKEAEK